jgi:hypothetical protein
MNGKIGYVRRARLCIMLCSPVNINIKKGPTLQKVM